MIEIKMVCKDCDYDFFGTEQFIDNLDDDLCNDHICIDEWTHQKGYTKNTVYKEEIEKYIRKQFNIKERIHAISNEKKGETNG